MPATSPSLRMPTIRDVVYSSKTFLAAAIALAIGFSQQLENPYWSALTCYVLVNPPGAGAIRSKAVFRLCGTLIGALITFGLTSIFADEIGVLATSYVMVLAVASYLFHIDRTPMNYMYFAICLTIAIIGLSNLQHPDQIFSVAATRTSEICLGIIVLTVVDNLISPEPQTPKFLEDMAEWRTRARDWLTETLAPNAFDGTEEERREHLRHEFQKLVEGIGTIDGRAVQLPFDPLPSPPRGYHLNLLRHEVTMLVGDLTALELWMRPLRDEDRYRVQLAAGIDGVAAWVHDTPAEAGWSPDAHVARGQTLIDEIEMARDAIDPLGDRAALAARGFLSRMASTVQHWCDLSVVLHAVATGRPMSHQLEDAAHRAKPVRSVDYIASALDLIPMVSAMTFTLAFWYATAWNSGPTALLFVFVGTVFLVGQPIGKAAGGLLIGLSIAFAFVYIYQFGILPRVTTFEMLILALGCGMIPVGVLMAQNMLGLIVSAMTFSFLGLQNAYHADLEQSLESLLGSAVGLLIATIFLSLGAYNQARFTSRRLADAVRGDVSDLATSRRLPARDRFLSLALYRLSLYFPAAEKVANGKPLPHLGLVRDLSVGANLLSLRAMEPGLSRGGSQVVRSIRDLIACDYSNDTRCRDDDAELHTLVRSAIDDRTLLENGDAFVLRDALMGLDLALTEMPEAPR